MVGGPVDCPRGTVVVVALRVRLADGVGGPDDCPRGTVVVVALLGKGQVNDLVPSERRKSTCR